MDIKRIGKMFCISLVVTIFSILLCAYLFNRGVFYKTDINFFEIVFLI